VGYDALNAERTNLSFTLLGSRFSVRVQVRFWVLAFGVLTFGSLALAGCSAADTTQQEETPSQWVVTDAGAGPLRVGMTADDIRPHVAALGDLGECSYAKVPAAPGLLVMLFDGKVVRLDVIQRTIATAAGTRVGDSEQMVRDLYPYLRVEPHKYTDGHYLIVDTAPGRRIVFETDGTRVTRYRAGAVPQVDWVEGCS
jgi:hypothetical protein